LSERYSILDGKVHFIPIVPKVEDVTVSRNVDVTYHNTSGRPKLIVVTAHFIHTAAGDHCFWELAVGDSSPLDDIIDLFGIVGFKGVAWGSADQTHLTAVMLVPAEFYYKIFESISGGSSVVIIKWFEITL